VYCTPVARRALVRGESMHYELQFTNVYFILCFSARFKMIIKNNPSDLFLLSFFLFCTHFSMLFTPKLDNGVCYFYLFIFWHAHILGPTSFLLIRPHSCFVLFSFQHCTIPYQVSVKCLFMVATHHRWCAGYM